MRLAAAALILAGCAFDGRGLPAAQVDLDAAVDAAPDAAPDAAADAPPDADPCPAGYAAIAGAPPGSQYRLVTATAKWLDAEAACEADGLAHLVVLDDDSERDAVRGALDGDMWTGVSDRVSEGTFFKVTTGIATYLPWLGGEPNDLGNEDCVELNAFADAHWNDAVCGDSKSFICELPR